MKYYKLKGKVDVTFRFNLRNWALPVAFGGGIWEDYDTGEYGQKYGCEMYWAVILSLLCWSVKVEWLRKEKENVQEGSK